MWRTPNYSPQVLYCWWRTLKWMWRSIKNGWRIAFEHVAYIELLAAGAE
jgi:hypothetical protein